MSWVKRNAVFAIALAAAGVTAFFVPPDKEYIGYLNAKTLVCLFGMLSIVCAMQNAHVFQVLAHKIVKTFKSLRSAVLALVFVTLVSSMFITNDMALIAFLPLTWLVLSETGNTKYMAFIFVIQTAAANLGGMLTPFGNPQNLYLYSYYNIPTEEFLHIMLSPFLLSVFLIAVCCTFIKPLPITISNPTEKLPPIKTAIYAGLFIFVVLIVFRVIPYPFAVFVPLALLLMDRKALLHTDYTLILTFCAFFVFSGNMARIPDVHEFLSSVISKNVLLSGVITSQFISNVPAAVLLSKFTSNYADLLVAVNIGGVGTIVASLASLIALRHFIKYETETTGPTRKFFAIFTAVNLAFLAVLTVFCFYAAIAFRFIFSIPIYP